jgi:hypothetical protein
MATEPMLQIPLKVVVVRDMSVPHADAPGFFVDFAAVKGSSSGKYLYREDFSDLTNDEFLQKGLDELRKGEEQAFVAVYTDRSQSEIYRLIFKNKLDTMYKKPASVRGQQVYVLDKDIIPESALCDQSQACEEPISRSSIDAWMTEGDAKDAIANTNRLFFNEFGIDFKLEDGDVVTSYLRNTLPEVSETLDYLGTVKRPPDNDPPAKNADKIKRIKAYNTIVDNLYLDTQSFTNKLVPYEKAINMYFLTFTGNTRQGNAGVGHGSSSEKVVMGQWTNKPTINPDDDDSLLRQRKIYVKEGTPSLTFTAAHELGHILDANHTDEPDFMNGPQSLLVATEEQIQIMRDKALEIRESFDLPEEPVLNLISGTEQNDKLHGTDNNDQIIGLSGKDKLFGLSGDDILDGGIGRDKLLGGLGADTFVISEGRDVVKDFSSFDNDKINIAIDDFSLVVSGNGRHVRLVTNLGSTLFKDAQLDDIQAAINVVAGD